MNLKDKTILITGATGGIGSVLTQKLKNLGCNIITVGYDPTKPATFHTNLSDPASRQELINNLVSTKTKIDILINNAGIGIYKLTSELTESDWYQTFELNLYTPIFLIKSLKPELTVNIGSCSALQHRQERALYNSSKSALRIASLCLADEHPGHYVHITLDSTLTPFGPLSLAEKIAKQKDGKYYLTPEWVANQIIKIMSQDTIDPEYCLSPECYDKCGIWLKP